MVPLAELTPTHFTAHLNQTFTLYPEAADPITLELIAVETIGQPGDYPAEVTQRQQAFSLRFQGPKAVYLPQRIYPLEHEVMGHLEIFLVPIAPNEQGSLYQAIFS